MNFSDVLRTFAYKFDKSQDSIFSFDIKKQEQYIERLGVPSSNIERSFFQYKCQMRLNGYFRKTLLNISAMPLNILLLLKYRKNHVEKIKSVDAVFFRDGKAANILPGSLQKEFKEIEISPKEGLFLLREDLTFIRGIMKKYPFSFFFCLKNIIKIARYRYVIESYNPKSIIVCAEYSFTSSLLTEFCKNNGIEHINVMHGEKLYHMNDSFFNYDRCYIWDDFYKELFLKLEAGEKQFIVEIPDSLKLEGVNEAKKELDYTYYLAGEKLEYLNKLVKILSNLKEQGYRVAVRPHPRYSDLELINKIFKEFEIESNNDYTIEESLLRTNNAIALYSTVLTQAVNNGINIVIDNITNEEYFLKLEELHYICIKKNHKLLSDYLGD